MLYAAPGPAERSVFSEHYPSLWHTKLNARRAVHQAAATWNDFVQIRFDDGRVERYDLATDPGGLHPLAALPAGAQDFDTALEPWLAPKREARPHERAGANDALQMLGYGK